VPSSAQIIDTSDLFTWEDSQTISKFIWVWETMVIGKLIAILTAEGMEIGNFIVFLLAECNFIRSSISALEIV
jgi:hypothetical protein